MKRASSIFSVIVLLLLAMGVASCGNRSLRDALQRAEVLMKTDPQAARAVLDSLEPHLNPPLKGRTSNHASFRRGRGEVALYAVLRTQADYKCFVPLTSDSLIRTATDFYGIPRHKSYRAAMAWYSQGCVSSELKNDLKAIDAYLHAMALFPDTTVRYYSLAEQNLGIHYLNRQMLDDALATFRSCSQRLGQSGNQKDLAYIAYYTALTHLYREEFAEASQGFAEAWDNPSTSRFLKGESLLQLAKIACHHEQDYRATLDYVDRHIAFTDGRYLGVDYSMKGDAYYASERFDSAFHYYRESLRYDNEVHTLCCDYKGLAELAPLTGYTDSLPFYVAQYTLLLDSIGELRRTEEIALLQNAHAMDLERRQLSNQQHWTWAISVFVFLLLLLLLTLWFVQRDRQRKSDYISLCDEIRQSQLSKYVTAQETLDACCALFRKTAAYELMSHAARMQVQQIDKKAPNLIAHDINTCFSALKKVFKSEAPSVNDKEFSFIVCHYLGFDTRSTSLFLSTAYSTLTAMKSRLKKKFPNELYTILFPGSSTS